MNRKALIEKLNAQLKKWEVEIDKLEAKKQTMQANVRDKYSRQIQELRDKMKIARGRLDEANKAGAEAWEKLKTGAEKAFDDVENAFRKALSRFK